MSVFDDINKKIGGLVKAATTGQTEIPSVNINLSGKEAIDKGLASPIAPLKLSDILKKPSTQSTALDSSWADAVFGAESSAGADRRNEFNDAGKYGWTVGFTKGEYNNIKKKAAQGDKRYVELLSRIDLDTPEGAKQSAIALANFKNIQWDEKGQAIGTKYQDPIDIYTHLYNASTTKEAAKNNFLKYYKGAVIQPQTQPVKPGQEIQPGVGVEQGQEKETPQIDKLDFSAVNAGISNLLTKLGIPKEPSQIAQPGSQLEKVIKSGEASSKEVQEKVGQPITNFVSNMEKMVPSMIKAYPATAPFYDRLLKPIIEEPILKGEQEFHPKVGEFIGGMAGFGQIAGLLGEAMATNKFLAPFVKAYPKLSRVAQFTGAGVAMDQLQTDIATATKERQKILWQNLPNNILGGVFFETPWKFGIPSLLIGTYATAKLQGQNNIDAVTNAVANTAMMSLFKFSQYPKNPYEIIKGQAAGVLGIKPTATVEEARDARNLLAHKYHPDKPTGDVAKMTQINTAYDLFKTSPAEMEKSLADEIKDLYKFMRTPEGQRKVKDTIGQIPFGLSIEDISKKKPGKEEEKETIIYRYGEPRAVPMSESTFFTPDKKAAEEYNLKGTEKLYETKVDESKLFKGDSSVQYAMDNNLMDKPMSKDLQKLTGLKTLKEVDDEYAKGVTKKASEEYQKNPNIYYTAFQQTVARELKAKGYAGARWSHEDDLTPTQYQIWDKSILKDKSVAKNVQIIKPADIQKKLETTGTAEAISGDKYGVSVKDEGDYISVRIGSKDLTEIGTTPYAEKNFATVKEAMDFVKELQKKVKAGQELKPKEIQKQEGAFEAIAYRGMVEGAGDKQLGEFYTTDKKTAELYSEFKAKKLKSKGKVIEEKIRIENPLKIEGVPGFEAFNEMQGKIPELKKVIEKMSGEISDKEMDDVIVSGEKMIKEYAKNNGYDGVIFNKGEAIIKIGKGETIYNEPPVKRPPTPGRLFGEPKPEKIVKTKEQLVKMRIREQAKGAKAGYKAGEFLAELRHDIFDKLRKTGSMDVKDKIIEYANKTLPPAMRGQMLTAVRDAKNQRDLTKAYVRIDQIAERVENKEMMAEIRKQVEKIIDSSKVAIDYKNKLKELISKIELPGHTKGKIEQLKQTREYIEKMKESGEDVAMPTHVMEALKILDRTPLKEMSRVEMQILKDKIDLIEKLGRTKEAARENLYKIEKQKIIDDIVQGETKPLNKRPLIEAPVGEKKKFVENLKNFFTRALNEGARLDKAIMPMDVWFDLLDGGKGTYDGPVFKNFKKRLDNDWANYWTDRENMVRSINNKIDEYKMTEQNAERIGVYAAARQKGGRQKLYNNGMTDEQIDAIELTKQEAEIYQLMRGAMDKARPRVAEIMKDLYNKDLGYVEEYFPFVTDFDKLSDAEMFDRFGNAIDEFIASKKNVEQGFTIERERPGKQKIEVNAFSLFNQHMDNVAYLLNAGKDIKILSEIAKSPAFAEKVGDIGQLQTLKWLDLMARKGGRDNTKRIAVLDTLRRNIGPGTLAFKLTSALIQPTAMFDGAAFIGRYAFKGTADVITSKKWRTFVIDNMPEIRARVGDDPAMLDLSRNKTLEKAQSIGLWALQKLDKITAAGIAAGAYEKYMAENGKEIDFENPDPAGIEYAQKVLRRSQASMIYKDVPQAVSYGELTGNRSLDRTLLTFQTFLLNRWSWIEHDMIRAGFAKGEIKKGSWMALMLIVAILAETGIRAEAKNLINYLTGNEDTDDQTFWNSAFMNAIGSVPFISPVVSMIAYDSNPIPIMSVIEKGGSGLKSLITGKEIETKEKGAVRAAGAAGAMAGIPGSVQVADIIQKLISSEDEGFGPSIKIPEIKLPEIEIPEINIPSIK